MYVMCCILIYLKKNNCAFKSKIEYNQTSLNKCKKNKN